MHNDELRRVWLNSIRSDKKLPIQEQAIAFGTLREQSFDLLADHFRKHVDMEGIYNIIHRGDGNS